jgi:hypothetical protein
MLSGSKESYSLSAQADPNQLLIIIFRALLLVTFRK